MLFKQKDSPNIISLESKENAMCYSIVLQESVF